MKKATIIQPQNKPRGPPLKSPVWKALLIPVRIPMLRGGAQGVEVTVSYLPKLSTSKNSLSNFNNAYSISLKRPDSTLRSRALGPLDKKPDFHVYSRSQTHPHDSQQGHLSLELLLVTQFSQFLLTLSHRSRSSIFAVLIGVESWR